MNKIQQPFSNGQLELLQLFSDDLPEHDLLELKRILAAFRFRRAGESANKVWEDKGWTEADMEDLLSLHERIPYRSRNDQLSKKSEE